MRLDGQRSRPDCNAIGVPQCLAQDLQFRLPSPLRRVRVRLALFRIPETPCDGVAMAIDEIVAARPVCFDVGANHWTAGAQQCQRLFEQRTVNECQVA